MFNFNKVEKALFGKLVKNGHSVACTGKGWVLDEVVYKSFKEFYGECLKLAN